MEKRILFISSYTPGNYGAGVAYTDNLIKRLSNDYYVDIVLFSYNGDKDYIPTNEHIKVTKKYIVSKLDKYLGWSNKPWIFPVFMARYNKDAIKTINELILKNDYICVYFDFSQTFSLAPEIRHDNKILMSHDVIYQSYKRKKSWMLPWVRWSENLLLKSGNSIFTFSEKDCELIAQLYKTQSYSTTLFLTDNVYNAVPQPVSDEYFVIFGSWDRVENTEALKWFLDNIAGNTNAKFKVIGGGMAIELRNKANSFSNIECLGFVDNPYPIIANAKAEIAPLHLGAGIKVKCIESLACGTSIIGTDVAFEGISNEYNTMMILANTPDEYLNAITNISETIEVKRKNKQNFIETYNNKKILQYIADIKR